MEAERLYQAAVADDGSLADAHAGLAAVRERTGDIVAARNEANAALKLSPSLDAYLVLGRLDLAANHMDDASRDVAEALKIDPASASAKELNRQIEARSVKNAVNDWSEPCLSKCVDSSSAKHSASSL